MRMNQVGAAARFAVGKKTLSPPPYAGGAITPSLIVEYVDTSGVRQTTTVATDGSTSISGVAPFLVHFDASGSRSTTSGATTLAGAWENLGYRINYGEALGTTWTYGGGTSRDEDTGPPIFGRAFTTTGTKTVRLRIRDSIGSESTIQLSVVVSAPPTATNIAVGAGAWPTWVSGTHYTLNRGSDYTSFGILDFREKNNILVSATGSGADPIVGEVTMDARATTATAITRASNIRLLNIDIAKLGFGELTGGTYVGAVFGRVRRCNGYSVSNARWYYENDSTTSIHRTNIKWPRGIFLWDVGEIGTDVQYVMISGHRRFHAYGVVFHKNGTAANHNLRMGNEQGSYRYCNIYATATAVTLMKMQAYGTTTWLSTDEIGDPGGAGFYTYPNSMLAVHKNQFGRSGESRPEICVTIGPQNSTSPGEGHEYVALEDNIGFHATSWQSLAGRDTWMGGRYLSNRSNKMDMGTGVTSTTSLNWAADGLTWDGPYLTETTNTRPVPTAF